MSFRKKMFFIFCFVFIDICLIIGFLVIRDVTQEQKLKKEVHTLMKLDITKDRYNTSIKSGGKYGKIEKSIKEYLDQYAVSVQSVLSIMNDSQFTQLLSVSNYETDGPDFSDSFQYIQKQKKEFNESMDSLIQKCDDSEIKEYIHKELDDPYYVTLYEDLMLNDDMSDDFQRSKETLENVQLEVNTLFDTSNQILEFLKINKDSWKIEDNQIKFQTQDLLDQYNLYVQKIKEISSS